jgi:hypothetical protein
VNTTPIRTRGVGEGCPDARIGPYDPSLACPCMDHWRGPR